MKKTQQLDDLFLQWQSKLKPQMKSDGIIDEVLFERTNPKVLFITKEPNDPRQTLGDFRRWWKEEVKYSFSMRIAEWSYGIQNDFPPYDEIRDNYEAAHDAIQKIAFMNIKKIGGRGSSEYNDIMEHLEMFNDLIHQEIDIIDPDLIILGVSWPKVRNKLFPSIKWENSGYDVAMGSNSNFKIIDFYHPSSRNAPAASYSLLENVLKNI